jgi:hypothetical protein
MTRIVIVILIYHRYKPIDVREMHVDLHVKESVIAAQF